MAELSRKNEFGSERLATLIYTYCQVEDEDVEKMLGKQLLFQIKEMYGRFTKSEIEDRLTYHERLEDDLK